MTVENFEINLDTNKNFEIIDMTSKINNLIANSKINNGVVNIFSKHSTSAICVNENEKGLLDDLEFMLANIIPDKFSYKHDNIDNNAKSHLKSFLLSSSESVPILNNKLNLGTWQSVFFIELDGPRHNRTINITLIGE
jgi:secondary thiamine-phosphate synthase enzyme